MELSGEQRIEAAQPAVWRALNDPEVLKRCIPGCESIEQVAEGEFKIAMLVAVGPVKARFSGRLAMARPVPPESYELLFEGSGGVAGFGKGSAAVALSPLDGGATLLRYTATAQVGGKLAQIGSRLIDGVARKMAIDFFSRFNQQFTAPAVDTVAAATAAAPSALSTPAGHAGAAARHAAVPPLAAPLPVPGAFPAMPWPVAGNAGNPGNGSGLAWPLGIIAAGIVLGDFILLGILCRLWSM